MGDAVALDLAAGEIDEVEAWLARRLGEVGDADRIASGNLMLIQRRLRAGEQLRVDSGRSRRRQDLRLWLRLERRERIARRRTERQQLCKT